MRKEIEARNFRYNPRVEFLAVKCLQTLIKENSRNPQLVWTLGKSHANGCGLPSHYRSERARGLHAQGQLWRRPRAAVRPPWRRGQRVAAHLWSGQPKNTESFVLVVDSSTAATEEGNALKTHWIVYDIPKEVTELREELSGAGASSVSRLGMKEDAGQAPVVCDSAWRSTLRSCCPDCNEPPARTDPCHFLTPCAWLNLNGSICR